METKEPQKRRMSSSQKISIVIAIIGGALTMANTLVDKLIPSSDSLTTNQTQNTVVKKIIIVKDSDNEKNKNTPIYHDITNNRILNNKETNTIPKSVNETKYRFFKTMDVLIHLDIYIIIPIIIIIMAFGHFVIDLLAKLFNKIRKK